MKKIILIYVIIIVLIFTSCSSAQNSNSDNCELCWSGEEWYDTRYISDPILQEESFTKENMENIEHIVEGVKYMMKYIETRKDIFSGEIDIYQCYDCSEISEENLKHVYMNVKNNILLAFYGDESHYQEEASITEEQAIEKAKKLLETENVCIDDYAITVHEDFGNYDISFMSEKVPDGISARFVDDSAFVRVSYSGKIYRFELPINQNMLEQYNLSFDIEEIMQKSKQRAVDILNSKGSCENISFEGMKNDKLFYLVYSEELGPCIKNYLFVDFDIGGESRGLVISACVPIEQ